MKIETAEKLAALDFEQKKGNRNIKGEGRDNDPYRVGKAETNLSQANEEEVTETTTLLEKTIELSKLFEKKLENKYKQFSTAEHLEEWISKYPEYKTVFQDIDKIYSSIDSQIVLSFNRIYGSRIRETIKSDFNEKLMPIIENFFEKATRASKPESIEYLAVIIVLDTFQESVAELESGSE